MVHCYIANLVYSEINITPMIFSTSINSSDYASPYLFVSMTFLHFCLISLYHEFSFQGGSEEELATGMDEITTKGKKSNKKVRSVSRKKRLKKTKNFRYMEESDQDKQDYSDMISEDKESVPQYSSEERKADESTEALRENVQGEEELESEGDQDNSDVGVSPGETEKSHIEPSSPDDVSIAEISDDVPLVNN